MAAKMIHSHIQDLEERNEGCDALVIDGSASSMLVSSIMEEIVLDSGF